MIGTADQLELIQLLTLIDDNRSNKLFVGPAIKKGTERSAALVHEEYTVSVASRKV